METIKDGCHTGFFMQKDLFKFIVYFSENQIKLIIKIMMNFTSKNCKL